MAFNYDVTKPADTDIISQFPANERAARKAGQDSALVEHDATSSGRHKIGVGDDAGRDAITDWPIGALWLNTEGAFKGLLQFVKSIAPVVFENLGIPGGTKMLFVQAAAPVGWTLDATHNDKVLRINDTTGGGSAGSWTITGVTVASHVLTTSEMPAHTHTEVRETSTTALASGGVSPVMFNPLTVNSGSTGGSVGHVHGLTSDGNWRPAYVDAIICTKD